MKRANGVSELTAVAVQTREQTRPMRPSGIVVIAGVKARRGKSFRSGNVTGLTSVNCHGDDDTPSDVLVFQTRRMYSTVQYNTTISIGRLLPTATLQ